MAEWLGTALQKLLQRFESASDLKMSPSTLRVEGLFFFLRRFLRLISTPKNLYKYKENHCGVQLLFRLCSA